MSKSRGIPLRAKVSYGNSQGYSWVHDPFTEELPYITSGDKREKLKKYNTHDYKRGKKNG